MGIVYAEQLRLSQKQPREGQIVDGNPLVPYVSPGKGSRG
jgi:hypothetical protein